MNHKNSSSSQFKTNETTPGSSLWFVEQCLQKFTLEDFENEFPQYEEFDASSMLRAPSAGYYTHKPQIVVKEPIAEIEKQFGERPSSYYERKGQSIPTGYLRQKRIMQQKAEEQRMLYHSQMKYLNSRNHSCNWCL